MSQFNSSAKQFPGADELIGYGSINVNVTTSGTTLEQTAPPSLLRAIALEMHRPHKMPLSLTH